ncbi:MAG TPA: cytochrome c oxidase subunit 3 [Aestuariivirga sp.]|jgi:cytochrome c oxidase subunit 3|nr:cytochrome c oxidase subunit 3 [Aestuariivirga sp.]
MADAHAKHHDYHLVDPSPWPAVGGASAFILAIGAVNWMHGGNWLIMALGFALVFYTMFMWWRDVIREAHAGDHTPVVSLHLRYGMIMFIASEVMFFVAWFWAFFDASLFTDEAIQASRVAVTGGVWPPAGTKIFDPWHLPLVNTLILLTSGTTVTWAHHALLNNDRQGLKWGLIATVALGALFTSVQAYEYAHAQFAFSREGEGNIYGSTFFMATGFHGFHVLIGTIFLLVCLFRAMKGHFTPQQHFGFEAAAWYWHFVDVVWLFLFSCVYVWASAGVVIGHE